MISYSCEVSELLDTSSPKKQFERIQALLFCEKKVAIATAYFEAIIQFKDALSKDHPELARFIPDPPFSNEQDQDLDNQADTQADQDWADQPTPYDP